MLAAAEEQDQIETFIFSPHRSSAEIAAATEEKLRRLEILERWKAVFDAFLLQSSSRMGSRELGGAILL